MHNSIRRLTKDSCECAQFRTVRAGVLPFLFISRTRLIGLPCGYYGTIIAENTGNSRVCSRQWSQTENTQRHPWSAKRIRNGAMKCTWSMQNQIRDRGKGIQRITSVVQEEWTLPKHSSDTRARCGLSFSKIITAKGSWLVRRRLNLVLCYADNCPSSASISEKLLAPYSPIAVGECLRKYVAVYRFCTLNNKENC